MPVTNAQNRDWLMSAFLLCQKIFFLYKKTKYFVQHGKTTIAAWDFPCGDHHKTSVFKICTFENQSSSSPKIAISKRFSISPGICFLQENTIETTGAGDTFCACILNYVLDHGLTDLNKENLEEMLVFANAAASLITTRKGALRVMPTWQEVLDFIAARN